MLDLVDVLLNLLDLEPLNLLGLALLVLGLLELGYGFEDLVKLSLHEGFEG